MYEINNLTFRYMLSDRNSLEQVSLKIKKGKILWTEKQNY